MKIKAVCAAMAILCAVIPAAAAQSSHDRAVLELFEVMGLERQAVAGATAMIDAQVDGNPAIAPYRDVMVAWATKYLTWDAMVPEMTRVYEATFTETEIRQMTDFYRTPTGQKVLATMPELMEKGAGIGMALARKHEGELEKMVLARKKELEAAAANANE
jgi:hypothetical protein